MSKDNWKAIFLLHFTFTAERDKSHCCWLRQLSPRDMAGEGVAAGSKDIHPWFQECLLDMGRECSHMSNFQWRKVNPVLSPFHRPWLTTASLPFTREKDEARERTNKEW